jgi:hypothetical protein
LLDLGVVIFVVGYSREGLLKLFVIFLEESVYCSDGLIIPVLIMLSFGVLDLFALMDS